MIKDNTIFLEHILESIKRIEEFTKEISKEEFIDSIKTQDAVIRRIEIIGEAVKNLPKSLTDRYSKIPWS